MAKTIQALSGISSKPLYEYIYFSEFHPDAGAGRVRFRVNLTKAMKERRNELAIESDALDKILRAPTQEQKDLARELLKTLPANDEEGRKKAQDVLDMPRLASEINETELAEAAAQGVILNDKWLEFVASLVMADDETADNVSLTLDEWKTFLAAGNPNDDNKFGEWLQDAIIAKLRGYQEQERFLSKR